MQEEGAKANPVTFAVVLNACSSIMALEEGRHVHRQVIESGCESDMFVGNTLVDMYAKCGSIEDSQRVFHKMPTRDVVSWNAMLAGYEKCEQGPKAMKLFAVMQEEAVKPNLVTFVVVLNVCASIMALEEGRNVHLKVIENGYESDVFVGSSLVYMYSKCGSIEDALRVFHSLPTRDLVCWTAMLAGYVQVEEGQKALELFSKMQEEGVKPNPVTFVVMLNACASITALEHGRRIHMQVIESGCESDLFVGNALLDMYAKCGSIEDAQRVFYRMPTHGVVSWTSMLSGFAMHGQGQEALQLFQEMRKAGVEMNKVTFICLLSACSRGGFVEEGVRLFESMSLVYGISQTLEHYVCMVDLLSRGGLVDEAEYFLRREPTIREDSTALVTLLSACRNHGQVGKGGRISQ